MGFIIHRSLVLLFILASTYLFRPIYTYPHLSVGIEDKAPLAGSSGFLIPNSTIEHSKRQDGTPCDDGPCHHRRWEYPSPRPSPPKPDYVDPIGKLICEPPPAPGQKYRDAHERLAYESARWFCRKFSYKQLWDYTDVETPVVKSVNITGKTELFEGDNRPTTLDEIEEQEARLNLRISEFYEFTMKPMLGCEPPELNPAFTNNEKMEVDLGYPLEGWSCQHIIITAWRQCNNKGRGGSLQAGCFRYGVRTLFWSTGA